MAPGHAGAAGASLVHGAIAVVVDRRRARFRRGDHLAQAGIKRRALWVACLDAARACADTLGARRAVVAGLGDTRRANTASTRPSLTPRTRRSTAAFARGATGAAGATVTARAAGSAGSRSSAADACPRSGPFTAARHRHEREHDRYPGCGAPPRRVGSIAHFLRHPVHARHVSLKESQATRRGVAALKQDPTHSRICLAPLPRQVNYLCTRRSSFHLARASDFGLEEHRISRPPVEAQRSAPGFRNVIEFVVKPVTIALDTRCNFLLF